MGLQQSNLKGGNDAQNTFKNKQAIENNTFINKQKN